MTLDEVEREKFEAAAEPLMEYLAEYYHPHIKIIVDSSSAELVESVACHRTHKFIKD